MSKSNVPPSNTHLPKTSEFYKRQSIKIIEVILSSYYSTSHRKPTCLCSSIWSLESVDCIITCFELKALRHLCTIRTRRTISHKVSNAISIHIHFFTQIVVITITNTCITVCSVFIINLRTIRKCHYYLAYDRVLPNIIIIVTHFHICKWFIPTYFSNRCW